jgi:hypothetical protein
MNNPFARDGQTAKTDDWTVGAMSVYDDDDESDDDADFDDDEEPSIHKHDHWCSRPGFGSPEWWSGT